MERERTDKERKTGDMRKCVLERVLEDERTEQSMYIIKAIVWPFQFWVFIKLAYNGHGFVVLDMLNT